MLIATPHLHPMPDPALTDALRGLTVFERGWLSSNNVLLHGAGEGDVLVDSSHALHGAQTVALLRRALGPQGLARIINTHLHSDHCGGNAAVQRSWSCTLSIPPGEFAAALAWDEAALSYRATGQVCERFVPDSVLRPGDTVAVGRRRWQALAAPGHDPHSIILFDAEHGVVISADALWQDGFGVVFPELDGVQAFDEVGETLELIGSLGARWVIPGHGAPFGDVPAALQRARRRLAGYLAEPQRHARHAMRVLVKYHLMELRSQPWPELMAWLAAVPLLQRVWHRLGRPEGELSAYGERVVIELVGSGALVLRDGVVIDA